LITHFTRVDCGAKEQKSDSNCLTDVNCRGCLNAVQAFFERYYNSLFKMAESFIANDYATPDFAKDARDIMLSVGFLELCKHGHYVRKNLGSIDCRKCSEV
jgi:hypothetical protein